MCLFHSTACLAEVTGAFWYLPPERQLLLAPLPLSSLYAHTWVKLATVSIWGRWKVPEYDQHPVTDGT